MWRGERNLYAFGPQEVESDLAALVDGPANGVFGRLPSMFPPPPDDRVEVSCYLAVLYFRNPVLRDLMAKAAGPRWRQEMMLWAERCSNAPTTSCWLPWDATRHLPRATRHAAPCFKKSLPELPTQNHRSRRRSHSCLGATRDRRACLGDTRAQLGTRHDSFRRTSPYERSGPCLVVPAGRSEPNHPECRVPSVPGEQRDHTGDAPTSPR